MSEAFRAGRRRPAFGDLLLPVAACLLAAVAAAAAVSASPAAGEKPLLVPDRIKADTLVILAHPDDEAVVAPLLVRDALEEKQRVVNIYLTPGQFGTDKVGDVKGPALGYLRLTELHWALDRLGVAMFHCLGRMDSGTQTDPGAVLDGWNRDRTVRELTRYIRLLRPGRLLAWFPGPASSHVDHAASGGAALLAVRSAANPSAYEEQMATEGLRPYSVPEVWLFAQPEKVSYEAYPSPVGITPEAKALVRTVDVDVFSEALGRRYTDVAREAMKEERTVEAATFTYREGHFDDPLHLIPAWDEKAPAASPAAASGARLEVRVDGSPAQKFLEQTATNIDRPVLKEFFFPEALQKPEGATRQTVVISNKGGSRAEGSAEIHVPEGWSVTPASQDFALDPGASKTLVWEIAPGSATPPAHVRAAVRVKLEGGNGSAIDTPFVLTTGRNR